MWSVLDMPAPVDATVKTQYSFPSGSSFGLQRGWRQFRRKKLSRKFGLSAASPTPKPSTLALTESTLFAAEDRQCVLQLRGDYW
jgi:hypothetical protein